MQVVGFLCIQAAQESGHPKYSQTEMWVANLLAAGVLLIIAHSQGNCLSFFWQFLEMALDIGKLVFLSCLILPGMFTVCPS